MTLQRSGSTSPSKAELTLQKLLCLAKISQCVRESADDFATRFVDLLRDADYSANDPTIMFFQGDEEILALLALAGNHLDRTDLRDYEDREDCKSREKKEQLGFLPARRGSFECY